MLRVLVLALFVVTVRLLIHGAMTLVAGGAAERHHGRVWWRSKRVLWINTVDDKSNFLHFYFDGLARLEVLVFLGQVHLLVQLDQVAGHHPDAVDYLFKGLCQIEVLVVGGLALFLCYLIDFLPDLGG